MIITCGGIKGGSGKTTLAVYLTVMLSKKNKVLLVDADAQATATDFTEWRGDSIGETGYTAIKLVGKSVRDEVKKLQENYDYVVIDVGGRDTTSQRAALTIADLFIAPFAPKSFDIWTLETLSELVQEVKEIMNPDLMVYALLNRADNNRKDIKDARDIILDTKVFTPLNSILKERKAISNASAEGLIVSEMKRKDYKAIKEIEALFAEVLSLEKLAKEMAG